MSDKDQSPMTVSEPGYVDKSEIQELREMQLSIQSQIKQMQDMFNLKFGMHENKDLSLIKQQSEIPQLNQNGQQLLGIHQDQQPQIKNFMASSPQPMNIAAQSIVAPNNYETNQIAQMSDNYSNQLQQDPQQTQLLSQLVGCVTGLQQQVADLQHQVHSIHNVNQMYSVNENKNEQFPQVKRRSLGRIQRNSQLNQYNSANEKIINREQRYSASPKINKQRKMSRKLNQSSKSKQLSFGQVPDPNSLIRRNKNRVVQTPKQLANQPMSLERNSFEPSPGQQSQEIVDNYIQILDDGQIEQLQGIRPHGQNLSKKKATVQNFIQRQQSKLQKDMSIDRLCHASNREECFAEKFNKFTVREFHNNTRMNIKNQNWAAQQEKRDRMVQYWQNQVLPNHLPPIDIRKRQEIIDVKQAAIDKKKNPRLQTSPQLKNSKSIPVDLNDLNDRLPYNF